MISVAPPDRRAVASWMLYDMANTTFSMGVVSLYFPRLIRDTVGAGQADRTLGLITASSMVVIFLVAPMLGAMSDRARRRMPFLVTSTLVCVVFTALLGHGAFWMTVAAFIVANIAFQAGLQFYDALLPDVSTPETRSTIGGLGISAGYVGSLFAVGLDLVETGGISTRFSLIALFYLVFALPCFLFVRERGNPQPIPFSLRGVVVSARETIRTLRSAEIGPALRRFLIGRVFYTDAINTIIAIMTLYTINVAVAAGLSEDDGEGTASAVMLAAVTCAIAGGWLWGRLADRIGPGRTLRHVLRLWMLVLGGAALVGILGLPVWSLLLVVCTAGLALGGVWAADRPYLLQLAPPGRIGEFYGLYGMAGRFSAVTGPLIWAAMTWITIELLGLPPAVGQGVALVPLGLLLGIGYLIIEKSPQLH